MRVLVTGAAGFIGSQLAYQLSEEGHEVYALVRPGTSTWRLDDLGVAPQLVARDLADADGLRQALRAAAPEMCVHLGWYVAPDVHQSPANLDSVTHGTNLLRALDEADCRRSVFVGTYLEYDVTPGLLAETTPLAPQNLYAASKHALHSLADAFSRWRGRSFVWARLFNVYGPREYDGPLVAHIVRHLLDGRPCPLTSGEQRRDYLHVADVARALSAIAGSDVQGAVNVGSGEDVAIATLARTLGELTGRGELLQFGAHKAAAHQAARICAEVTRLRASTDFRPRYSLRDGLAQTVNWWRAKRPSAVSP